MEIATRHIKKTTNSREIYIFLNYLYIIVKTTKKQTKSTMKLCKNYNNHYLSKVSQ